MSCQDNPRMLAGLPSMISEAPMLTTWSPAASAAASAALRFSVALYSPTGSGPDGTLILESAEYRDKQRGEGKKRRQNDKKKQRKKEKKTMRKKKTRRKNSETLCSK